MPAKALHNELQSLQTFQFWQVENTGSSSSKNVKSSSDGSSSKVFNISFFYYLKNFFPIYDCQLHFCLSHFSVFLLLNFNF